MSGGAASGESFAADADNAAWLDPRAHFRRGIE